MERIEKALNALSLCASDEGIDKEVRKEVVEAFKDLMAFQQENQK